MNTDSSDKKYYECEECDMFCEKCKGQASPVSNGQVDYGSDGDKSKCVTCS